MGVRSMTRPTGATHTDNQGNYYHQRGDGQWLCFWPRSKKWQPSIKINSSDSADAKLMPLSKPAHSATNCADLPVTPEEDAAWNLKTMPLQSQLAMKAYREQSGPWDKGEARIDQIGRNGNDGIAYDEPLLSDEECEALTKPSEPERSKYHVQVKEGVWIDVYDVLAAFGVTNPALAHLIKKALKPGDRGHKDKLTDLRDIVQSAQRALELEE